MNANFVVYSPPEKELPYLAVCSVGSDIVWAIGAPDRKSANAIIDAELGKIQAGRDLLEKREAERIERRHRPRKRVLTPRTQGKH